MGQLKVKPMVSQESRQTNMVHIREIAASDTWPLRQQILRPGLPLETAIFDGDNHADTNHFGGYIQNQQVGVASIFLVPCKKLADIMPTHTHWQLRGMATAATQQGRGVGSALLQHCLSHINGRGSALLWCNARASAKDFYSKQGFQIWGEQFEIPSVGPHFIMWRKD